MKALQVDVADERIGARKSVPWAFFEHHEDPGKVTLCLAHGKLKIVITNEQSFELGDLFSKSQVVIK